MLIANMNFRNYIGSVIFITVLITVGLIIHFSSSGSNASAEHQEAFQQANQFYKEQKYSEAITQYRELLSRGINGAHIHHNLASSYQQEGDIGRSILHYTKVLQLDYYDGDTRDKLAKIRQENAFSEDLKLSVWQKIVHVFSATHWVMIASLALFSLVMQLVFGLVRSTQLSIRFQVLATVILIGLIVFSVLAIKTQEESITGKAIILAENSSLRVSPFEEAAELASLQPGKMVTIVSNKEHKDYIRIRLKTGKNGWLKSNELELIQIKRNPHEHAMSKLN